MRRLVASRPMTAPRRPGAHRSPGDQPSSAAPPPTCGSTPIATATSWPPTSPGCGSSGCCRSSATSGRARSCDVRSTSCSPSTTTSGQPPRGGLPPRGARGRRPRPRCRAHRLDGGAGHTRQARDRPPARRRPRARRRRPRRRPRRRRLPAHRREDDTLVPDVDPDPRDWDKRLHGGADPEVIVHLHVREHGSRAGGRRCCCATGCGRRPDERAAYAAQKQALSEAALPAGEYAETKEAWWVPAHARLGVGGRGRVVRRLICPSARGRGNVAVGGGAYGGVMRPVTDLQRRVAPFRVESEFQPSGDQPEAIAELAQRVEAGEKDVVLLGATGTGKSATTAWLIEKLQRPTLVMAPEQDPRRAAGQRVPRAAAAQRRRVLRLVLRLLPARGVHRADRHLHREGLLDQRRGRAAAALGHRTRC